jgi:hypothetical protein
MGEEGSRRTTQADITFVALAVVAGVVLLYLGRSLTFWYDEWRSITFTGGVTDYLRPVNEHWLTLPLLLYRATLGIFGLRTYQPYLAEVIVLHLSAVAAAYVLMRRRVDPFVATALTIPLFFLGAGSENLFWAFQTGFVGSVMFGLWAIVFIERPGRWSPMIASVLLLASLMSAGLGLVFLVACFGRTFFDTSLRIRILATIAPAAAYLVWFSLVGRVHDELDGTSPIAVLQDLARCLVRGVSHAVASFSGVGHLPGGRVIALVLVTVFLIATCRAVVTTGRHALAAGCILGIATNYALVGLVRADFPSQETRSRYVYPAAFLLVLAVADWLPVVAASVLSRRYARVAGVGGFVLVLGAVTVANIDALAANQAQARLNADVTRAYISLALDRGDESWVDRDSVFALMPPVPALVATIRKHGSPLRDYLVPGPLPAPGRRAREIALLFMVGDGFRVVRTTRAGRQTRLVLVAIEDVEVAREGSCFVLRNAGREGAVTFSAPGGAHIRVTADSAISGAALLGHEFPPSRAVDFDAEPSSPAEVVVPDTGDGHRWRVRLQIPAVSGRVSVCGTRLA